MGFVLARIQIRYGNENLKRFEESLTVLSGLMAEEGLKLRYAMTTHIGPLYEVWDLWEVDGPDHMHRARKALREKPAYHTAHEVLRDVIESEEIRYLEAIAVPTFTDSPGQPPGGGLS